MKLAMQYSTQVASRFRAVFLDGKWVANTNYSEILGDVSLAEANQQIASLNTIGLLTFHINYYLEGLLQVFGGGSLDIRDKYSFDMPPLSTEADWKNLVLALEKNAEAFATYIDAMENADLDAPFVKAEYGDYRRNIEAVIEHSYYHLGQISLIKKMIRKGV